MPGASLVGGASELFEFFDVREILPGLPSLFERHARDIGQDVDAKWLASEGEQRARIFELLRRNGTARNSDAANAWSTRTPLSAVGRTRRSMSFVRRG